MPQKLPISPFVSHICLCSRARLPAIYLSAHWSFTFTALSWTIILLHPHQCNIGVSPTDGDTPTSKWYRSTEYVRHLLATPLVRVATRSRLYRPRCCVEGRRAAAGVGSAASNGCPRATPRVPRRGARYSTSRGQPATFLTAPLLIYFPATAHPCLGRPICSPS